MRIWIDADACPNEIREVVFKASERVRVPVILVADRWMNHPKSNLITMTVVPRGADSADDHIVASAQPNDLAITDDMPLADQLIKAGVAVVGKRGTVFNESNIGERLASRDLLDSLRGCGIQTGGPKPFGPEHKKRFAEGFDRVLTACLAKEALHKHSII